MTLSTRKLIALCAAHGIDVAKIWDMTVVDLVRELCAAQRRRWN